MKTNNIFDHMNNDPDELNEQTVIEETGVRTENVKEIFKDMVKNNGKKKNKRSITKVFTILAAAAAATIAAGTITAGATGSFNNVFGQIFAGEADNGMFSGGNVNISSETLNIDFKGITGDQNKAYGLMDITNKDGNEFISDPSCEFIYQNSDDDSIDISCSRSLLDNITSKLYYRHDAGSGTVSCELKDSKTIQAIIEYGDEEFNIIGQTLTIHSDTIKIAHTDKVLYTLKEVMENAGETDDKKRAEWENKLNEYNAGLKEDQQMIYDRDANLVIATIKTVPFSYDLSVNLNYKDIARTFDNANGKKTTFSGSDVTIESLIVRPFSAELDLTYPTTDMDELNSIWEKEESADNTNSITITLKSGAEYSSSDYPMYLSDNHRRLTFVFYGDNYNRIVMNPNDIKSIVYNGTELYNR